MHQEVRNRIYKCFDSKHSLKNEDLDLSGLRLNDKTLIDNLESASKELDLSKIKGLNLRGNKLKITDETGKKIANFFPNLSELILQKKPCYRH